MMKIWHLLRVITLWTIWIKQNDQVFNREQWHESKVKHRIWGELIIYAKAAWNRVIKQIKICRFSAVAMLQGFDKTWGERNVFVGGTIWVFSGTGRGNIGRFGGLGVVLGLWGGSRGVAWFGGFGGLSVVGVGLLLLLTWRSFASKGSHLPSVWAWFLFSYSFWRWLDLSSVSKKTIKTKKQKKHCGTKKTTKWLSMPMWSNEQGQPTTTYKCTNCISRLHENYPSFIRLLEYTSACQLNWWVVFMGSTLDLRMKTPDAGIPLPHTESRIGVVEYLVGLGNTKMLTNYN